MILRRLKLEDEAAFRRAVAAWDGQPGFVFARGYQDGEPFAAYLERLAVAERGDDLPPNWVPETLFCGFIGDEVVGRLSLRHHLNDHLLKVGGHIGYGVLPAQRRRGHASAMLAASLPHARALGLERVLVTCDEDNVGSARTIEKNGGVLENVAEVSPGAPRKRRYWIDL